MKNKTVMRDSLTGPVPDYHEVGLQPHTSTFPNIERCVKQGYVLTVRSTPDGFYHASTSPGDPRLSCIGRDLAFALLQLDNYLGQTATQYLLTHGRGSGRTHRAMLDAPRGAVYVWCNDGLDYPCDLARKIGRTDLRIVAPRDVERRVRGCSNILVDHAFPRYNNNFAYDFLRAHRATFCE